MPTFNVGFLNPKLRTSSGGGGTNFGVLTDELTILENSLARDGILTEGDYDVLIARARELEMAAPSVAKRSDLAVKVSGYEKAKSLATINRSEDSDRITKQLLNEAAEDVFMVGGDPQAFLEGREASLRSSLNELAETIERRGATGNDVSEHMNQYYGFVKEYQDVTSALEVAKRGGESGPAPGFAAYVKTNNNGEITDVTYGRYGAKSGYVETNATIGGFQVYGKVNSKRDGQNMFVLGNEIFSGVDVMQPDPENPGAFKPTRLISQSMQTGQGGFKTGQSGYYAFEPGQIQVQQNVPKDSWAKATDGTVYYRRQDGNYTKYLNVNRSMEGRPDPEDMLTLPKSLERGIMRYADDTVDESLTSIPFGPQNPNMGVQDMEQPQQEQGGSGAIPTGPMSRETATRQQASRKSPNQGVSRSSKPTDRATGSFADTARRTIASGAEFVKGLFG